jgi:hypothetical protein
MGMKRMKLDGIKWERSIDEMEWELNEAGIGVK